MSREARKGIEGEMAEAGRSRLTATNNSVKLISVCQSRGFSAERFSRGSLVDTEGRREKWIRIEARKWGNDMDE